MMTKGKQKLEVETQADHLTCSWLITVDIRQC